MGFVGISRIANKKPHCFVLAVGQELEERPTTILNN